MTPRGLIACVTACALVLGAGATSATLLAQDAPALSAHFEAPPTELLVGAHGTLLLVVEAADAARQPLLVTPSSDGPAVEVVHGRLFRADAEDSTTFPLRFRVPIYAAGAGDAVVRARVDGYTCLDGRCQPVVAEAVVSLWVRRGP